MARTGELGAYNSRFAAEKCLFANRRVRGGASGDARRRRLVLKSGGELFYVAEQEVDAVDVLVDVPVAAVPALAGQPALNGTKPLPGG